MPQNQETQLRPSTSATGDIPGKRQKHTPCQWLRNWCHHWRSRWNSRLRRIGWSFFWKQHERSIMRRKKVLPGQTTFAAWCKWPISDLSSCLLHHFWSSQEAINSCKAESLSAGSRATWLIESSSMPKIVRTSAGPTHLSGWRGSPSRPQTARAVFRLCVHWGESGGPTVMKGNVKGLGSHKNSWESTPPGLRLN